MHRFVVGCAIALGLSAAPAWSADNSCKDEVAAAFMKQRSSRAFSMESVLKAGNGPVTITVEYLPPDRMRQKIVAPGQSIPLETVLVGTRAWSRQGGAWKELMPAIAQTIIAQVREAVIEPPKAVGNFSCIDKVTIDGKEYLAYRSIEKSGGEAKGSAITKPVHRTIYVDPDTGLPAVNIVSEDTADATPIFKAVYGYPTDLVIEGYPDAPLAKIR
jgi:outer membrane lipoprotein-sorting protein